MLFYVVSRGARRRREGRAGRQDECGAQEHGCCSAVLKCHPVLAVGRRFLSLLFGAINAVGSCGMRLQRCLSDVRAHHSGNLALPWRTVLLQWQIRRRRAARAGRELLGTGEREMEPRLLASVLGR